MRRRASAPFPSPAAICAMTATITPATQATTSACRSTSTRTLWRAGLVAGVCAAAATVAAVAHAMGASLETAPGEAIPAYAFGQLTLFFTAVGVLMARTIGRRPSHPRSTFIRTTLVLTALSVVPDLILSASVATKGTLLLTHVVAATIVIPALSSRLAESGRS